VPTKQRREYKIVTAIVAGTLVWLAASLADIVLVPIERSLIGRILIANVIGGLMATVVTLAVKLQHEEVHYRFALERAGMVAEVNHNVRNAVFPLVIAVQKLGNPEVNKVADFAVERINMALKDATTDALARRVEYSAPVETETSRAA
jgi:hypothetical protein